MSLATRGAKQRTEKHDTDSVKQARQKTHGAAPKQNVYTKESKDTVKELRKSSKDSESTVLRQNSVLLMEKEKQQIEIQKLQEENTKLKQSNEEYKNLKEELEKTKDLLAQKESEITQLKEDIQNLQKRSTGEVGGLENCNHCCDSLLHNHHDHVLSGAETTPEAMMQPEKIQPEPFLLERDHTFQELRGKFVTLESHNSANLPPASRTTVISVNCKTDFQNVTKSTDDTERSENRNKLNESGNDPRQSQVEKGDDEDKEEGTRIFKAEVCTENFHEVPSIEDKDKHKIEDIEVPVQERTEEKNSLLSSLLVDKDEVIRSISRASSASYESVRGVGSASTLRSMSSESSTSYESVHGFGSTSSLQRLSQVKKSEHEEEDGEDRKRILNEESCTKTLHQDAGTDEKYKHKIEELEALVKELTNEKNQLSNRPSQVETKKEEERKQNLKAELRGGYPHEQAGTEGKYRQKIEQLEVCVKELTKEKNTLLNRLSEIGAMKMTDNNPNVTDLSDDNRPEKLVEQFSELYDNEWVDAYVHLTKAGKTMELSVKLLLQILKDAYDICLSSATEKATTLRTALLSYAGLSDEDSSELELQKIEKKLSEYRTKKSQCNIACVEEEVKQKFRNRSDRFEIDISSPLTSYINTVVRICWFMCIKNPPMLLDFGETEESAATNDNKPVISLFDRSKFMPYTTSGDYVEYVAWPAVFAHEDGPIMRKGVAQGFHAGNSKLKTN